MTGGALTVTVPLGVGLLWAVSLLGPRTPQYPTSSDNPTNVATINTTSFDWPRLGGCAVEAGSIGSGGPSSSSWFESPAGSRTPSLPRLASVRVPIPDADLATELTLLPTTPAAVLALARAVPRALVVAAPVAAARSPTVGVAPGSELSGWEASSVDLPEGSWDGTS